MTTRAALDIETTGLNPWQDRVTTVALVNSNRGAEHMRWVYDEPEDEYALLMGLTSVLEGRHLDEILSWNGSEFDLPFLAVRYLLHGIGQGLGGGPIITPMHNEHGKYGKPRYEGIWVTQMEGLSTRHHDVAYDFAVRAAELGVQWSLKPVAKALGLEPKEFDFSTGSILDLSPSEREDYCISDAEACFNLFTHPTGRRRGIHVGLRHPISFLTLV